MASIVRNAPTRVINLLAPVAISGRVGLELTMPRGRKPFQHEGAGAAPPALRMHSSKSRDYSNICSQADSKARDTSSRMFSGG
jgi:hypothetical protein